MNYIYYQNKHYPVPACWDEMTESQFLAVINLLFSTETEARGVMKVFKVLSGLSWWMLVKMTGIVQFKRIEQYLNLTYMPRVIEKYINQSERLAYAIEECTAFLFVPAIVMSKQKLPWYRNRYGPSSDLRNIRMAEFANTEYYFLQYKVKKDLSALDKLVAILYRREKKDYDHYTNPDGDHRERFNPNIIDAGAVEVASWPAPIKKAIAMFYEGVRNKKIANNEKVFDDSKGEESLYGLWSLMRGVAKSGHFGDFDKVEDQFVDTILMEMNEVVVEGERLEAQLESQKN